MRTLSTYNQVKTQTLEIVADMGEVTANKIAELTGRTNQAAAMALLKYFRFGLLHRYRIEGEKTFSYSISEKGVERLDYLLS